MATFNEDIVGGRGFGMGGGDFGGGGVIGGLLIGALLGRGGLGGFGNNDNGRDCRDCVTNESLNQQTLGDIKAAIPLAESQVQLALAGAVSDLTLQGNNNTQTLLINQFALEKSIAAVDTNVDRQSTAIQVAIANSERNVIEVLNQNRIRDLEQQLTVAQLRESEQRAINREQNNSHNVTTTVNTNQQQAQLQAQRQEFTVNQLLACVNGLAGQVARATNSNVIVGNTGASTTGAQTANPTNVNA